MCIRDRPCDVHGGSCHQHRQHRSHSVGIDNLIIDIHNRNDEYNIHVVVVVVV